MTSKISSFFGVQSMDMVKHNNRQSKFFIKTKISINLGLAPKFFFFFGLGLRALVALLFALS